MARGRIPDPDITAIRGRTPIEGIVVEYANLRLAGADFLKRLSPFKDGRAPSFHVRPDHDYYHHFSTERDGDVSSFLVGMEHLSFPETVEARAKEIDFHINYEGGDTGRRGGPGARQRLITADREAQKFYREQLSAPAAVPTREFLENRGFAAEHTTQFDCDYSSVGWDTLTKHLQRLGFSFEELDKASLSKMGRMGPTGRFHHRLMQPIRNMSGDVIGFGVHRLLDNDNLGRYMNMPKATLYRKSGVLSGLDLAEKNIAAGHQAVTAEDYTNVMAMYASGVATAVVSCDTAFSEERPQLLRRLILDDNFFHGGLIYTFDGDEIGQKATVRALEGEQNFTGQSYVVVTPGGTGPCGLRRKKGGATVRDLVTSRWSLIGFVLHILLADYDLTTASGRVSRLCRVIPVLAQLEDTTSCDECTREVIGQIGWNDGAEPVQRTRKEVNRPQNGRRIPYQRHQEGARVREEVEKTRCRCNPTLPYPSPRDPVLHAQRETLKLTTQRPATTGPVLDALVPRTSGYPAYRVIFDIIVAAGGACRRATTRPYGRATAIMDQTRENIVKRLVTELGMEQIVVDTETLRPYMQATPARLQEMQVGDQITQLKAMLPRVRPSDDETAYDSLSADLLATEQYRYRLQAETVRAMFEQLVASDQQPRRIRSSKCGVLRPIIVWLSCLVRAVVSAGRVNRLSRMRLTVVPKSEQDRPVAPGLPEGGVSSGNSFVASDTYRQHGSGR